MITSMIICDTYIPEQLTKRP